MHKLPIIVLVPVILSILLTPSLSAGMCPGGALLINPHGSYYSLPIMLTSPATFTIESCNSTIGILPHIVIVMTRASLEGLSGPVVVTWGGSPLYNQSVFPRASFQSATAGYIPDQMVTPYDTGRYNVSDLKQNLGVNGTEEDTLYYNFGPLFAGAAIGTTPRQFTVIVPSTHTRVLVLAVARSGVCTPFFNMRVSPCTPGFIVPEVAPILFAIISFGALILYATYATKSRKLPVLRS